MTALWIAYMVGLAFRAFVFSASARGSEGFIIAWRPPLRWQAASLWERFILWERLAESVGRVASASVDSKGRVLIPKEIRDRAGIGEGSYVRVWAEGGKVLIEPLESVADKFFGAFEVGRWPRDLDEFLVEAIRRRWTSKGM